MSGRASVAPPARVSAAPPAPASVYRPEVTHWGGRHGRELLVLDTSAWNGLAFNPHQTWAFRRAELTPFSESPFRVSHSGERVTLGHIRTLPVKAHGAERLMPLIERLVDALAGSLAQVPAGTGVYVGLCLPERMGEGASKQQRGQRLRVEQAILGRLEARGLRPVLETTARGHASFAFALRAADRALAEGRAAVALVGGVDTAYDPAVIEALADEERLFDSEHPRATLPGEGGALVLVGAPDAAARYGLRARGSFVAAATAREPGHLRSELPCQAGGLSAAANAVTSRLRAERTTLDWWLGDVTGEPYRVQEFQLAWPRAVADTMTPASTVELLPSSLGDLGAATMATGVAIAVEGLVRGAPLARNCLITGSSDGEDRGVVLVQR